MKTKLDKLKEEKKNIYNNYFEKERKSNEWLLKNDNYFREKTKEYEKEFEVRYGVKPSDEVNWENIIKLIKKVVK